MERDKIRAVFFDVFGTLILYPKGKYSAEQFSRQAERLGLSITPANFAIAREILKERVETEVLRDPVLAGMEKEGRMAYWEWYYGELLKLVGIKEDLERYAAGMWVEYIFDPGFILDPEALTLLRALRPQDIAPKSCTTQSSLIDTC